MPIDFSDIVDNRDAAKTPLDAAKSVELRMLRIFDRICKKCGLRYCLAYGTLLGAIRHQGFIPWDDDVDVHMPLDDYKRFVKIANEVLPSDLVFVHSGMSQSRVPFGKIFDRRSFYLDSGARYQDMCSPMGIFMDIFPLTSYRTNRFNKILTKVSWHAERMSHRIGVVNLVNLARRWLWMCVKYLIIGFLDYGLRSKNGRWLGVPYIMMGGFAMFDRKCFSSVQRKVFEGYEFCVPIGYDACLSSSYGDYMKLPPVEKRFTHAALIVPKR